MRKSTLAVVTAFLVLFAPRLGGAATKTLLQYPRLYKGMRSLAMGGALTAVGGDSEALFYNPAGLHDMDLTIEVVNPLLEADENAFDVGRDIVDAMDLGTEQERLDALTSIIQNNQGKPLHARVSLFPNVAWRNYAVGFLGQATLDGRLHEALGSAGTIETISTVDAGPVAGASFALPVEGLRVGIGGKWIYRAAVNENFTAQQLAASDFDLSDFDTTHSDFSFDIGLMYDIPFLEFLKPRVGLAALDITDLDFGRGGQIPFRLNFGASINPEIPFLASFILSFDYEDLTGEYSQDDSSWKRVHLGAELGVLDRHILLRLGVNQGYATAGAELDIWIMRLGYTYYSEETGPAAGEDRDTRHLVQLILGW